MKITYKTCKKCWKTYDGGFERRQQSRADRRTAIAIEDCRD